jgi:hypothetical protein
MAVEIQQPTRLQWQTTVEDPAGRTRAVVVTSDGGRVAVAPPPGEGFSMNTDEADYFAASILAAANRARRDTSASDN